jgi:hypothetical protein
MTDRDAFAAAALSGLIASRLVDGLPPGEVAVLAYKAAEAMLVVKRAADTEDRRVAALQPPVKVPVPVANPAHTRGRR